MAYSYRRSYHPSTTRPPMRTLNLPDTAHLYSNKTLSITYILKNTETFRPRSLPKTSSPATLTTLGRLTTSKTYLHHLTAAAPRSYGRSPSLKKINKKKKPTTKTKKKEHKNKNEKHKHLTEFLSCFLTCSYPRPSKNKNLHPSPMTHPLGRIRRHALSAPLNKSDETSSSSFICP